MTRKFFSSDWDDFAEDNFGADDADWLIYRDIVRTPPWRYRAGAWSDPFLLAWFWRNAPLEQG